MSYEEIAPQGNDQGHAHQGCGHAQGAAKQEQEERRPASGKHIRGKDEGARERGRGQGAQALHRGLESLELALAGRAGSQVILYLCLLHRAELMI
jgi:hypothetical protein